MGPRRNTRRPTSASARLGRFVLTRRCTTHDAVTFRGAPYHARQSGACGVPALRFRPVPNPVSALSPTLKIIGAAASAYSLTSSALPFLATKIDQYPYCSLRLRSNLVIENARARNNPLLAIILAPGHSRSTLIVSHYLWRLPKIKSFKPPCLSRPVAAWDHTSGVPAQRGNTMKELAVSGASRQARGAA